MAPTVDPMCAQPTYEVGASSVTFDRQPVPGDGRAYQIASQVADRRACTVVNTHATATVYLVGSPTGQVSKGLPLAPGAGFEFGTTAALYAIATADAEVCVISQLGR